MIAKIVALVVGIALGAALLGVVAGLAVGAVVVGVLGLTLLVRRDFVPIVYNLRSLGVRKVTTTVTAAGLALVVFVFATVLMLSTGITRTLTGTGSPENAKIIRKGSQTELQSGLLPEHFRLLSAAPEVAAGHDGKPLASQELVVLIYALKAGATDDTQGTNLGVRGVGKASFELHPEVKLDGRAPQPGTSEIAIGKNLVGRFQGANLGGSMRFARRDWQVVGILDAGGSAYDSEIWGDFEQVMDAFQRRPSYSSVTMRLKDRAALSALKARLEADPQLNTLEVKGEIDYWKAQSEMFANFVQLLGLFVAIIFSLGAILGAMITMYAQVAARTREIGTLRAIGFRRRAVLVSFVVESVLLSLVAGGAGLLAASLLQLASFTTVNWMTFSEVTFRFRLDAATVVASLVFAAIMGFAGGLLPAMRASRMAIVQATRGA